MGKWKSVVAGMASIGIFMSFGAAAQAEAITSYDGYAGLSSFNATPIAKPRWTLELDSPTESKPVTDVAVRDGKALFLRGGVLTAVDAKTGRTAWTYGAKLTGAPTVHEDRVLAASTDGRLHWVDLKTGKAAWTAPLRDPLRPEETIVFFSSASDANAIYVTYPGGVAALSRNDGRKLWSNDAFEHAGHVSLHGDYLLFTVAEQGALTVSAQYRLDPSTGESLWRLGGSHGSLLRVEGRFGWYRNDQLYVPGTHELLLERVDLDTGTVVETKSYLPIPADVDPLYAHAGLALMDGDRLYAQARSGEIVQYHIDAEEGADPTVAFEFGDGHWIAGPYDGKLFFTDPFRYGTVYARKLLDRTRVDYEGLDNPASRVDLIGRGLFVGQTDGEIYAVNVSTGKAAFRYRTDARTYGAFHVTDGILLAQAEGKLLAFDLPAELLEAPVAGLAAAPPKAEASLRIDGDKRTFEPSPVMIDNRMFVPLRALFQAVGAEVDFDEATGDVNVTYAGRAFTLREGAPFALVGGRQQAISYAPALVNGAVYVPLRDVGGLLGVEVLWVNETRTVEITTNSK